MLHEIPADRCQKLELAATTALDFDERVPESIELYDELTKCVESCPGEQIEKVGRLGTLCGVQASRYCPSKLDKGTANAIIESRLANTLTDTLQTP